MNQIVYYVLSALAVLLILTIHEYSHAYAAYRLGDNTARNLGRLSLNPIKHLDPVGAICMLLFHFGWAKPVPINARNFKKPKRDFAITALAGPLSNLICAFISALFVLLLKKYYLTAKFQSDFVEILVLNFYYFTLIFHQINVGIAIFNLIPIPPLDGSRLLNVILPTRTYFRIMRYERNIYLGMILWLLFGDFVARGLLSVPFIASSSVLSFIAGLFSLSNILGGIFNIVSNAMLDFWQLIPFLNI